MAIVYPASIRHGEAVRRAFVARNGELGFLPADAEAFISACEVASLAVPGWEVWLVDHELSFGGSQAFPSRCVGQWCGLIPTSMSNTAVMGGTVAEIPGESWPAYVLRSGREVRNQIASCAFEETVLPQFLNALRLNFTTSASP